MNEHKQSKFIIDVSSQAKVLNRSTTRFFSYDSHTAEIVIQAEKDGKLIDQALVDTVEIYFESVNLKYRPIDGLKWNDTMDISTDGLYSYILPDDFLNYEGLVAFDVYINYKNGDRADSSNRIIFEQRVSAIDRAAGVVELVYIKDMETVKREITEQATEITENFLREWNVFEAGSTVKMQKLEQRIDEQTEIFNNADVYNKAEIEDKLEPFALQTDIDTLEIKKADKTTLANTNQQVSGLASNKVDKNGASQVTWPMIAQDVRAQMLGDTPPAIVGPGSVLNENIVEGAVSPLKTDFIKTGKNLYDKRKITDGYYLDRNNGMLMAYASSFVTNYIYIGPNLPVSINILNSNLVGVINYCIYGLDKVRLRGGQLTSTSANPLEMGEDGFYLRFSAYKDYKDSLQVEIGESSTDFQDFYLVLDEKIKMEQEVVSNIFDPTEIGLTVRPSGFDVYIKGSESAGNQYFKYPIEKAQKDYISGDLSSNYDTLNIVTGYKATRENNLFRTGLQIIQYGEWEMAIKENGATDFVGGMTHGDEILTTYAAFFDGKYIEFGESQTLFGKEFIIESHSDFYRDTSITNGELLKLGKHYKKYVFNKDGLTLTQKIEWATDVTLSNCYLCMLPIKRKTNNDNTGDNITTNAMSADLVNYDISEANWIGGLRTPLQGRKRINIWGETSGISAYIENKATPDLSDGLGFVQNTLTYNKYYFDFSGVAVVHTGDVWENVTTMKIDVKEP